MTYNLNLFLSLLLFTFLLFSCSNDFTIVNQSNKEINRSEIKADYIVMLGNGFCHDCIVNLVYYLNAKNKSYVVVYPNLPNNNLVKITLNEFLQSIKVDLKNVYWLNQKKYDEEYKNLPVPFVIKKQDYEILKYETLFDKNGKLKVDI